jgi:hypothetical protein
MKITTFKTEKYRDCPVYIRNFADHFEYLTVINGEIYTAHVCVRPHWLTKLFYRLDITSGFDKVPYSQQQLKNILTTVSKMAQATIDFVLDKNKN